MKTQIRTEYDPTTRQVHVSYGSQVQKLFQECSNRIAEVIDERTFAELCDKLGDTAPHELASAAILISHLARSRSASTSGEEWNWAVTLVAWTILRRGDSPHGMGELAMGLVVLGYIAPVELPDLKLPPPDECLSKDLISKEAWAAYEGIRGTSKVRLAAVPVVATADKLWRELRHIRCNVPAFHELLMRLETASMLYRFALQAAAQCESQEGRP